MILIAESGATKTDWCAVSPGMSPVFVKTGGINLASMPGEVVNEVVREALEIFRKEGIGGTVEEIHFYAAGLIAYGEERVPPQATELDRIFHYHFPEAYVEYASDLVAAARSVCGHEPGVAAILGTGSNSCFFDGENVVRIVRSGGFILGDEGGAARLGKIFMSDFLKGLVPEPVASEFARDFEVDYMTVVQNVYKGGAPARYLGSFAPWIVSRYNSSEYVRELVESNFRDFCRRVLLQYDTATCTVGVVGGFGYAYRDILKKVADPFGIKFSRFIQSPVEGLVDYHLVSNCHGQ